MEMFSHIILFSAERRPPSRPVQTFKGSHFTKRTKHNITIQIKDPTICSASCVGMNSLLLITATGSFSICLNWGWKLAALFMLGKRCSKNVAPNSIIISACFGWRAGGFKYREFVDRSEKSASYSGESLWRNIIDDSN